MAYLYHPQLLKKDLVKADIKQLFLWGPSRKKQRQLIYNVAPSDATENFYEQSNGSSRQSILSSILPVVFGVQLLYMRFTFYCPGGMHIAA